MPTGNKPLIIAEKPSAARAIAEALGGFSRREGYLESDQYLLSWAVGHLLELMAPEDYEPRWKRWSLESLPILPPAFGLKVAARTKSQYDLLVRLGRQAPELINACDAAREGELIFRYICQAGGLRQPVRRLWVSALTKSAIRKAFGEIRPAAEYDRLYRSALCRAQGDWLVGMNATRVFTVKYNELLSVGRVQTPTLALLVRREEAIERFAPEGYWEVHAGFEASGERQYQGQYFSEEGNRLKRADEAEAVRSRVQGQPGRVESVQSKQAAERPPQLYDLTSLQRDANRRFGLTAAATLKTAQALYEAKLITYPRTDSRHLSQSQTAGLTAILKGLGAHPDLRLAAAGADLSLVHPGNRRVIDDSKVTDHHAIIPTGESASKLTGAEATLYGLIARRFLAQFYPDARYEETEVITAAGPLPDRFRSRGRRLLQAGWKAVEPEPAGKAKARARGKGEADGSEDAGDGAEPAGPLPALTEGEPVLTREAQVKEKSTEPPRRYNEATLLGAMESAGKEMDDEALREAMKGRGLGTPATRAAIIERLKQVGYITLEKRTLTPTEKGRRLIALAERVGAQVLLSAELTGEWEKRIADIQAGTYDPDRFMAEVKILAAQVVEGARRAEGPVPQERGQPSAAQALGACPRCGRGVMPSGRNWVCSTASCGLRIPGWLCGKVIEPAVAATLLKKGKSSLLTGFVSQRTGKSFRAYLVLREGKVEFEFPPSKGTATPARGTATQVKAPATRAGRSDPDGKRASAPKTGSRPAGRRPAAGSGGRPARPSGTRVGPGAPGSPESARK